MVVEAVGDSRGDSYIVEIENCRIAAVVVLVVGCHAFMPLAYEGFAEVESQMCKK